MSIIPLPSEPLIGPSGIITMRWWRYLQQLGVEGMSRTASLFDTTLLTASAAAIYTMPTTPVNVALASGRVRFTNIGGGSHTITAYAVPAGGVAAAANCFANAEAILINTHLDMDLPALGAGDAFWALADAINSITVSQLAGVLNVPGGLAS